MEFVGLMSGGAPLLKSYQVDATISNVGVPLLVDTAGEAGLNLATTTSATNMVGINLDTVTYTTTQGTGANSAERKVRVIINPDILLRMRMSGGSTSGTSLALQTTSAASSGGTTVTTGTTWAAPTYDEGVVWGYDGANAGQVRKITSVSTTAGTVTIPFDNAIASGDNFIRAPYWFNSTTTVQLTSDLTEADATIAVGTGAAFRVVDMELGDIGSEGRDKSYIVAVPTSHIYK